MTVAAKAGRQNNFLNLVLLDRDHPVDLVTERMLVPSLFPAVSALLFAHGRLHWLAAKYGAQQSCVDKRVVWWPEAVVRTVQLASFGNETELI